VQTRLESLLDGLGSGDAAVIDAAGVEVFDFSFANELFGRSIVNLPGRHPGRFLIVEGLTEYTRENLEKALESLNLAMVERSGPVVRLLGKVHPADDETFAAIVRAHEPVSAATLRDQLGVNLTAINERLTKLSNLGVVRREKGVSPAGREQYLYSAPL
jgi:biotin operon repressor